MNSLDERFWEKVRKSDGCWEWIACVQGGYGRFKVGGKRGMMRLAHRVSWELTHGAIEHGLFICHRCDNKRCVRPDHLFIGTQKDNMADCSVKHRFNDRRGEKNIKARLTVADVVAIRARNDAGESYRKLSAVYGVSFSQIGYIVQRKSWAHV